MVEMNKIPNNYANFTLTDIPYDGVSKNGAARAKYGGQLRKLDKEDADVINFNIKDFLEHLYRITSGSIVVFCGQQQLSEIFSFFHSKDGSTRQIVWRKTNPSPMNGQHIYLSAAENAVWFKKRKTTFNAHCKSNVFDFPNGRSKLHPTEKNHELLRELILDNSNHGDIVFDPCMGSGSHLLVAREEGRRILGMELNEEYFEISKKRLYEQ